MTVRALLPIFAAVLFVIFPADAQIGCPSAQPVPPELRLPVTLPPGEPVAFERQVLSYFSKYEYRKLGWCSDKEVRDTGPFIDNTSYGTHTAVRIYYSPEVIKWLTDGRQDAPPDGAVIIKEQYGPAAPAAKYQSLSDQSLRPTDWTFMIRKASASKDGWFWGEVWSTPAMPNSPTQYPNAGFDLYCLRCHASAEKAYTFSSLKNIKAFPGDPITFKVDDSWRRPSFDRLQSALVPKPLEFAQLDYGDAQKRVLLLQREEKSQPKPAPDTVEMSRLKFVPPSGITQLQSLPPEPLDHAGTTKDGVPQFLTSDNCLGCHSAATTPPGGPSMWIAQGPGINVSPYGEWRWSPMGLAGRDPIFYAQLESELAYVSRLPDKGLPQTVINTCMQCHGAMGKRAFAAEHPNQNFQVDFVTERDPAQKGFRYGGLARDGISCAVCHHIADDGKPLDYFLEHYINGKFEVTKPEEIHGPFADDVLAPETMKAALGTAPKYNSFVESSRLCGSCHTIQLPVVDGHPSQQSVEQNTYIEWLNSQYQNEYGPPNPRAKTCQDCHMKGSYANEALEISVPQIQSRIALVQDKTYPMAEYLLPLDKIDVRYREQGYRRHELLGLNGFLLEMFGQFSDTLGVRTADYMSLATNDLQTAVGNVVQQAQHEAASMAISAAVSGGQLTADVSVTSLAGHRFPSGVGFRRAFLEFDVVDTDGKAVFSSGRTDSSGVILGAAGQPLPTEFFVGNQSQPHFDEKHPITNSGQVQIFEELTTDADGNFTTSFLRRDKVVKDNRLLPIGWSARGPDPSAPREFLEETHAIGTNSDPNYENGEGTAKVRYQIALPGGVDFSKLRVEATLYYQSIPPYYLRDRFGGANGPATKRLEYFVSHLSLAGTPFENWKLRVASATTTVR